MQQRYFYDSEFETWYGQTEQWSTNIFMLPLTICHADATNLALRTEELYSEDMDADSPSSQFQVSQSQDMKTRKSRDEEDKKGGLNVDLKVVQLMCQDIRMAGFYCPAMLDDKVCSCSKLPIRHSFVGV